MGRYYYNAKTEADSLKKITIFRLNEWGYLQGSRGGVITWTSGWSGEESSVGIQTLYSSDGARQLRIHYTQTDRSTDEKTDFDYMIPIVSTPCNLGGKRYWFICPWYRNGVYCGRRVGALYKGAKHFACRHCHNLSYASKNENRRFYMFDFGQLLRLENKIDELESKMTTKFYNGNMTRKYKKLIRMKRRYSGIDLRPYLKKVAEIKKMC